jgi:carboxymethylenebutenolidase
MQIDELTLETADGPMAAYQAVPDGGARRAVVVIQEAFGINEHIQDVTRRFADAGYHAIAPALFHRAGGGTAPYDDFNQVLPLFEGLTDPGIVMDVEAAIGHLHTAGFEDGATGIVGFCMGGRVTFLVALEHALGASVGFYGGGIVTARFPQFPALIERVGLFGDEDSSIPVEDVERLRQELDGADVPSEIVRYPGAEHGFHCDVRPSYDAEAATDAWARTMAWFEQHLEPRD